MLVNKVTVVCLLAFSAAFSAASEAAGGYGFGFVPQQQQVGDTENSTSTATSNATSSSSANTTTSTTTSAPTTTTGNPHKFGPINPGNTLLFDGLSQSGLQGGYACTTLSFSAQLRDSDGVNVTAQADSVTLQLWSTAGKNYTASAVYVADGLYVLSYSTPLYGDWWLQLFVNSDPADPVSVTITPQIAPNASQVFELGGETGLHGGPANRTLFFHVQYIDCGGLPFDSSQSSLINISLADSLLLGVTCSSSGLCRVAYEAQAAGLLQQLTVYVSGAVVGSYLINITFVPPPPPPGLIDPENTLVWQRPGDRGLLGGPAGSPLYFVLQLRDSNGDNITGLFNSSLPQQHWNVSVELALGCNFSYWPLDVDGLVLVEYSAFEGWEMQPLWVFVNGIVVADWFSVNVTRSPSFADYANALLFNGVGQLGVNQSISLQQSSFSVQLVDQYGDNFTAAAPADVTFVLSGLWPWGMTPTFAVSGGQGGLYVVSYTTPWTGRREMHLYLNGVLVQPIPHVVIQPATPVVANTLMWQANGQPGPVTAAVAGVMQNLYVVLRDANNNNITYPDIGSLSWTFNTSAASPANATTYVVPPDLSNRNNMTSNGVWLLNFTLFAAGPTQLVVQLQNATLPGGAWTVNTVANVPVPSRLAPCCLPSYTVAGTVLNFTFTTLDQWGNAVDAANVMGLSFNVSMFGPFPPVFQPTYLGNGRWMAFVTFTLARYYSWQLWLIQGGSGPRTIDVAPGPAAPGGYVASPLWDEVAENSTFYITVGDQYRNAREDLVTPPLPLPAVSFTLVSNNKRRSVNGQQWSPSGPPTAQPPTATVTWVGDGQYQVVYGSTMAGQYQVSITVQGQPIYASPFSIYIAPGELVPERCSASGDGVGTAASNVVALRSVNTFTITSRDIFGNPTNLRGGDAYLGNVQSYYGTDVSKVFIVDNLDGTYTASYSLNEAGNYWIVVQYVAGTQPGPATTDSVVPLLVPIQNAPYLVASHEPESSPRFSAGALAGSIVGVFFGAVLLTALVGGYVFYRWRQRSTYAVIPDGNAT